MINEFTQDVLSENLTPVRGGTRQKPGPDFFRQSGCR